MTQMKRYIKIQVVKIYIAFFSVGFLVSMRASMAPIEDQLERQIVTGIYCLMGMAFFWLFVHGINNLKNMIIKLSAQLPDPS